MESPSMTDLNNLLSTPLAKITDNGFTEQVLKRINNYYRWRSLVLKSLSVTLVLLFVVLSSPVILLSGLNKVTTVITLKLAHFSQIDLSQHFSQLNNTAIFSQLSQQPVLWLVLAFSVMIILSPHND